MPATVARTGDATTLVNEQRISLKDAARSLRKNYSTVARWASRGCSVGRIGCRFNPRRVVILETLLVGSSRETTVEAVRRFIVACNQPPGSIVK